MQEQLNETDQKANALLKLLNEHKEFVANSQALNDSKLEELFKKNHDQAVKIKMDETAMDAYKIELETKMKDLEARFGAKLEQ